MSRGKYHCKPCDVVVKAKHGARCPKCGQDMAYMGTRWRPGRQGTQTRMWDRRQEPERPLYFWDYWKPWWQQRERLATGQPPRRVGRKRKRAIIEVHRSAPVPQRRRP